MSDAVKTWDAQGRVQTIEDLHRLVVQSNRNLQGQLNAILAQLLPSQVDIVLPQDVARPEVTMSGRVFIEDVGGGTVRLVVYVNGVRHFINADGTF